MPTGFGYGVRTMRWVVPVVAHACALTGAEALRLITLLERMLERGRNPSRLLRSDHSQDCPVRIAFRGDSPSSTGRKRNPGNPDRSVLNEVDRRLAALGREAA